MKSIEFTPQCHYGRHIPTVSPIQTLALVISALQTHVSRLELGGVQKVVIPIGPGFSGKFLVLCFIELSPRVPHNSIRDAKCLGVFNSETRYF